MTNYQVKPNGRKNYELYLDNQIIGNLHNYGTFKRKTEILIRSTRLFEIIAKSLWSSVRIITENGRNVLEFKIKWTGKVVLTSFFENPPLQFIFKKKGLLKNEFVMLNERETELFSIIPSFKLKKFNYEYEVRLNDLSACPDYLELLIMTGVYIIEEMRKSESS